MEKSEEKKLEPEKSTNKKKIIISIVVIIIIIAVVVIILVFTVFKKGKNKSENTDSSTELDTIPSEELEKARNSFQKFSFTDTQDSSKVLNYNLFIPEDYSKEKKYPLIVFIGDSSTVSSDPTTPVKNTVGGPIWATDTVQKKHECIVLVPGYDVVIIDDRNGYTKSEYINVTVRLISELQNQYSIDSNRIYGTGQSMGAMTTLYLLANFPDLYAAGLIVDGQWKMDELTGITEATFTYFAAGGDEKAFAGQKEVKSYLDSNNIKYGSLNDVNAQEEVELLNNCANEMYESGYNKNFITYANGTVFSSDSQTNSEHMASFKYGYRIEAVRDWIFSQAKTSS